jgi:hypothetical protein
VFLGEQSKEFSTGTELKDKEELLLVLEGVIEFDNKWVVDTHQDVTLNHDVHLLFTLLDVLFLEDLHSVHLAIVILTLHQHHLCVRALPYHAQHIEVLQGRLAAHPIYYTYTFL